MIIRIIFSLSLLSFFVFQNIFALNIDIFTSEEQELIKKFYSITVGFKRNSQKQSKETAIQQAKEMIETVAEVIPNYGQTRFSVSDLFTTTFDTGEGFWKKSHHFLFDYIECKNKDAEFFDYYLRYIDNIDDVKNEKGRTLFMELANEQPQDSIIVGNNPINDEVGIHCFQSLLKKGASLSIQDQEGHDAISIALLSHNIPIIHLIEDYLQQYENITLNEHTQILLDVYQGKSINIDALEQNVLKAVYRVANQTQNFQLVDSLYTRFFKDSFEEVFLRTKEAYYFHPPLWAYNICQMKEYAIATIKQLLDVVIDERNLQHTEGPYYKYNDGSGEIVLRKKDTHLIGRILGRNHLEKVIQREEAQSQLAVPRKFLTLPSADGGEIEVEVRVPALYPGEALNMGCGGNPISLAIKGVTIYAEFIEGKDCPTSQSKLLSNDPIVRKIGKEAGFVDYGHGNENFIQSKKDGKIYFIDTEDRKNFIQKKMEEGYNEAAVKAYCFDPRIQYISIPLSIEDLK